MNYKSLWKVGHHKDLSKWIALLSRFNSGSPLNRELITKIEDFFEYYWENNRLSALKNSSDVRFMDELPASVQSEIFIDYLFSDFLHSYRTYFYPKLKRHNTSFNIQWVSQEDDQKMREFLVEFVKQLEPRFYKQADDEMI